MLENRTVIVTGANGALGRAVCAKAQALGARTIEFDLNFDEPAAHRHAVDLTDTAALSALVAKVGAFDAVFNIAGGFDMGMDTWDQDDSQWRKLFVLNVDTLRSMLKVCVPALIERGSGNIVNIGAYGALRGQGAMSAYCASKSVVMRLTESLAEEVRHLGVNVNAVLPTVIDTPANRTAMPDADPAQWVAPEELASAVCFLGSRSASAIHGALLPVRGLS